MKEDALGEKKAVVPPMKPRRDKGDGGLFKINRPGRRGEIWQATQIETVEVTGNDGVTFTVKKKITGTGSSGQDARTKLRKNVEKFHREPLAQKTQGNRRKPVTVKSYYYDVYLKSRRADSWNEHVRTGVRQRMEQHVLPSLGDTTLALLDKQKIKTLFDVTLRLEKGLKDASQVNVWRNLYTMLSEAKMDEVIQANPMDTFKPMERPRKKAPEDVTIPLNIVSTIQQKVQGTPEEPLRMISLLYGLRIAELLGLTWDVIHPNYIEIRQQLKTESNRHGEGCLRVDGKYECGKTPAQCPKRSEKAAHVGQQIHERTKSKRPRRIPMVEPITSLLKEQKKRQDEWKRLDTWQPAAGLKMNQLVFTTSAGKPLRQQDVGAEWKTLLSDCDLPELVQHKSRHIAITALVLNNTPLSVIGAIVGHADTRVTEQIYTHINDGDKRKHLENIGRAFPAGGLVKEAEDKEREWKDMNAKFLEEYKREVHRESNAKAVAAYDKLRASVEKDTRPTNHFTFVGDSIDSPNKDK